MHFRSAVTTTIPNIEVEVNLRPTISQPVYPGVRRKSGTREQFFFLLEISFRQLRLCYFVAPSLTRGRVCKLPVQLLLGLARAVTLGSKSRRTDGHILLSHLRLPQPGRSGSRIYILQEQSGPVIPRALVASYDSLGYGAGILTRFRTGKSEMFSLIAYIGIQFVPHRNHTVILTRLHTGLFQILMFKMSTGAPNTNQTPHFFKEKDIYTETQSSSNQNRDDVSLYTALT
jgi:hypothetical protein